MSGNMMHRPVTTDSSTSLSSLTSPGSLAALETHIYEEAKEAFLTKDFAKLIVIFKQLQITEMPENPMALKELLIKLSTPNPELIPEISVHCHLMTQLFQTVIQHTREHTQYLIQLFSHQTELLKDSSQTHLLKNKFRTSLQKAFVIPRELISQLISIPAAYGQSEFPKDIPDFWELLCQIISQPNINPFEYFTAETLIPTQGEGLAELFALLMTLPDAKPYLAMFLKTHFEKKDWLSLLFFLAYCPEEAGCFSILFQLLKTILPDTEANPYPPEFWALSLLIETQHKARSSDSNSPLISIFEVGLDLLEPSPRLFQTELELLSGENRKAGLRSKGLEPIRSLLKHFKHTDSVLERLELLVNQTRPTALEHNPTLRLILMNYLKSFFLGSINEISISTQEIHTLLATYLCFFKYAFPNSQYKIHAKSQSKSKITGEHLSEIKSRVLLALESEKTGVWIQNDFEALFLSGDYSPDEQQYALKLIVAGLKDLRDPTDSLNALSQIWATALKAPLALLHQSMVLLKNFPYLSTNQNAEIIRSLSVSCLSEICEKAYWPPEFYYDLLPLSSIDPKLSPIIDSFFQSALSIPDAPTDSLSLNFNLSEFDYILKFLESLQWILSTPSLTRKQPPIPLITQTDILKLEHYRQILFKIYDHLLIPSSLLLELMTFAAAYFSAPMEVDGSKSTKQFFAALPSRLSALIKFIPETPAGIAFRVFFNIDPTNPRVFHLRKFAGIFWGLFKANKHQIPESFPAFLTRLSCIIQTASSSRRRSPQYPLVIDLLQSANPDYLRLASAQTIYLDSLFALQGLNSLFSVTAGYLDCHIGEDQDVYWRELLNPKTKNTLDIPLSYPDLALLWANPDRKLQLSDRIRATSELV